MSAYFVGVDLGGTNLRTAVVDIRNGEHSTLLRAPTPLHGTEHALLERIAELVNNAIVQSGLAREQIGGVGIGVPGSVDLERGVVLLLPNIPGNWPTVPFAKVLSEMLCLPVNLLNDVRSITLAEWKLGAGRGVDSAVCYAIGTGIGGGVVTGGRLHLGISGSAGELGHQVVEPYGPPCKCGGRGCLELYAAGPAIRAAGLAAVNHGLAPKLRELTGGDLNLVSVECMAQAARDGDRDVIAIFEHAAMYLGLAMANTLVTVSPNRIILSGGVAEAADLMLDTIRATLRERVFLVPVERVEIVRGQLGGDAGLIGAALWAKENFQ